MFFQTLKVTDSCSRCESIWIFDSMTDRETTGLERFSGKRHAAARSDGNNERISTCIPLIYLYTVHLYVGAMTCAYFRGKIIDLVVVRRCFRRLHCQPANVIRSSAAVRSHHIERGRTERYIVTNIGRYRKRANRLVGKLF